MKKKKRLDYLEKKIETKSKKQKALKEKEKENTTFTNTDSWNAGAVSKT